MANPSTAAACTFRFVGGVATEDEEEDAEDFEITASLTGVLSCYQNGSLRAKRMLPRIRVDGVDSKATSIARALQTLHGPHGLLLLALCVSRGMDHGVNGNEEVGNVGDDGNPNSALFVYALPNLVLVQEVSGVWAIAVGSFVHPLREEMLIVPTQEFDSHVAEALQSSMVGVHVLERDSETESTTAKKLLTHAAAQGEPVQGVGGGAAAAGGGNLADSCRCILIEPPSYSNSSSAGESVAYGRMALAKITIGKSGCRIVAESRMFIEGGPRGESTEGNDQRLSAAVVVSSVWRSSRASSDATDIVSKAALWGAKERYATGMAKEKKKNKIRSAHEPAAADGGMAAIGGMFAVGEVGGRKRVRDERRQGGGKDGEEAVTGMVAARGRPKEEKSDSKRVRTVQAPVPAAAPTDALPRDPPLTTAVATSQVRRTHPSAHIAGVTLSQLDESRQLPVLEALRRRLLGIRRGLAALRAGLQTKALTLGAVRARLLVMSGGGRGGGDDLVADGGVGVEAGGVRMRAELRDVREKMVPLFGPAPTRDGGVDWSRRGIDSSSSSSSSSSISSRGKSRSLVGVRNSGAGPVGGRVEVLDAVCHPIARGAGGGGGGGSVVVFARVHNGSLLPVFDLHLGLGQTPLSRAHLSTRPAPAQQTRVAGLTTVSGQAPFLLPSDEAWLSCAVDIPMVSFFESHAGRAGLLFYGWESGGESGIALTVRCFYRTLSEASSPSLAAPSGSASAAAAAAAAVQVTGKCRSLTELLCKDRPRACLEVATGWLPSSLHCLEAAVAMLRLEDLYGQRHSPAMGTREGFDGDEQLKSSPFLRAHMRTDGWDGIETVATRVEEKLSRWLRERGCFGGPLRRSGGKDDDTVVWPHSQTQPPSDKRTNSGGIDMHSPTVAIPIILRSRFHNSQLMRRLGDNPSRETPSAFNLLALLRNLVSPDTSLCPLARPLILTAAMAVNPLRAVSPDVMETTFTAAVASTATPMPTAAIGRQEAMSTEVNGGESILPVPVPMPVPLEGEGEGEALSAIRHFIGCNLTDLLASYNGSSSRGVGTGSVARLLLVGPPLDSTDSMETRRQGHMLPRRSGRWKRAPLKAAVGRLTLQHTSNAGSGASFSGGGHHAKALASLGCALRELMSLSCSSSSHRPSERNLSVGGGVGTGLLVARPLGCSAETGHAVRLGVLYLLDELVMLAVAWRQQLTKERMGGTGNVTGRGAGKELEGTGIRMGPRLKASLAVGRALMERQGQTDIAVAQALGGGAYFL